MNKKFSTFFMACMFLLGTVSAFAQTAVPKLVKGDNEGLYQLRVGSGAGTNSDNHVLAIDNDGIIRVVDMNSATDLDDLEINLAHTLWCVHVNVPIQGVNPVYQFLNKATGQYLSVISSAIGTSTTGTSMNTPILPNQVVANGDITTWAFSGSYDKSLNPAY